MKQDDVASAEDMEVISPVAQTFLLTYSNADSITNKLQELKTLLDTCFRYCTN